MHTNRGRYPAIRPNIGYTTDRLRIGGLPNKADLLTYLRSVDAGGLFLVDTRTGTGTHQAVPRISTKFDGVLYGKLVNDAGVDTSVTLVGDFTIDTNIILGSGGVWQTLFAGNGVVEGVMRIDTANHPRVFINSAEVTFTALTVSINEHYIVNIRRNGTVITVTLTNSSGVVTSGSLSLNTSDFTIRYLGNWVGGQFMSNGSYTWDIHITDSAGVVFSNHLAQYNPASNIMESEVGPDVLVVGNTGDWTEESLAFGHDWNLKGYSEYTVAAAHGDGVERIVNGGFDTDTGWSKDAGWTINNGKANCNSVVAANIYKVGVFTLGKKYTFTVTLSGYSAGSGLRVYCGLGDSFELPTVDGTYSFTLTCTTNTTSYIGATTGGYTGSVDSISAQEITIGRIPEDPSNLGYDVTGGALTNPGKARNDFAITGYGPNFDGVAYVDTGYVPNAGFESGSLECDWTVGSVIGYSLSGIYGISTNLFVGNRDGAFVAGFEALSFNEIKETVGTATIGKKVLLRLQWDATRVQLLVDGEIVSDQVRSGGIATNTYPFAIGARATSPTGLTPSNMVTGSITNVKLSDSTGLVKEWLLEGDPADTTVTTVYDRVGGSHGTWVGATQPIYSVEKAGSLLLAGGYSEDAEGPELVVNGTFDTDTAWTKGAGWTINTIAGVALSTGVSTGIAQDAGLITGRSYLVTFEVTAYTSGSVKVILGGTQGSYKTATGIYTATMIGGATSQLTIYGSLFVGSIDNISIKHTPLGLVPASLTTPTQDVFGNALNHLPGRIYPDTPVLLTAPDSGVMFDADSEGQVSGVELQTTPVISMPTTGTVTGDTVTLLNGQYVYRFWTFSAPSYEITFSGTGDITYRFDTGVYSSVVTLPHTIIVDSGAYDRITALASVGGAVVTDISIRKILDPINFLYEPDEDKIPFTPAEMFPQSGGGLSYSLNDQYWFGQKGIAFYPAPLETKDATKMIRYIKPYEV